MDGGPVDLVGAEFEFEGGHDYFLELGLFELFKYGFDDDLFGFVPLEFGGHCVSDHFGHVGCFSYPCRALALILRFELSVVSLHVRKDHHLLW